MTRTVKVVVATVVSTILCVAVLVGVFVYVQHARGSQQGQIPAETPGEIPEEVPGAQDQTPVALTVANTAMFEARIDVAGDVLAMNYAMVPPRMEMTIEAIYVDEGDVVQAGKTRLFRTDAVNITKALDIARKQLAVAECSVRERQANLKRVQADYDKASLDFHRFRRLYEQDNAVTRDAFEQQESRFKQLTAALEHVNILVELARKQQDQAVSALAIAEKDLSDSVVIAPMDGVITGRFREPGEMGNPGQPIVRIEDLSVVEVSAFLPVQYYARVHPGQTPVRVVVGGVDLGEHTVSYRSPTADPKLRTFEIKCVVADPPDGVVPGAIAEVAVVFDRREGLAVPIEAIQKRDGRDVVFVVSEGVAHTAQVRTGLESDGLIEILSGDLTEGQAVVSMGQHLVKDGSPVRVVKESR